MNLEFTDAELEAYLEESLNASRATDIEQAVREDRKLLERLSMINGRRDAGIHTLGEIWRRNQIGVPAVEVMQGFHKGELSNDESAYIKFRMEELKCPFTLAMFRELEAKKNENLETSKSRREKFFEKSARLLRKNEDE